MVCPILEQQLSYNYRAWLNELEWKRSICAKLLYARRLKRGCLTFALSYPETIHLKRTREAQVVYLPLFLLFRKSIFKYYGN